jgi:hypothetical protein
MQARTGSTYLVEALHAHPNVEADYEVMSKWREQQATPEEQVEFARAALSDPGIEGVEAVGFKTKLRDVLDREGLAALLRDVSARVIVLRRRNLVKLTVSWCNAERLYDSTGDWNAYDPNHRTDTPFEIDPDVFEERLAQVVDDREDLAQYAESIAQPTLFLFYEDLLHHHRDTLEMTFGFLGVRPLPTQGRTVKNTADDLTLVVSNLDELRSRYHGTRFEPMFDAAR